MKRILLLFIALAAVWGAAAKIRLPEIIGNDMVLQQNAEVRLWGCLLYTSDAADE